MSSKTRENGNAAQRRAKAMAMREAEARKARQRRAIWISATAVAAVLIVLVALIVVRVSGAGKPTPPAAARGPAPASVAAAVSSVPVSTLDKVGAGGAKSLPKAVSAPAVTANGKPRVLYVGAEYCPYCAAQRWPMVVALSRFGRFSNLGVTHSASGDVYPNTATLSFHGSTYTSDYLVFDGVETTTNVRKGNSYEPLDSLSASDQALLAKYDAPPYVASSSSGAIPFVAFGGRYVLSGASYSPQVLAGQTAEQISAALANPDDTVATSVNGSANAITASLCTLTGGKPGNVCDDPVIKGLQARVNANK